jgi:hypothetical protein
VDLVFWLAVVLATNGAVFVAGCALAAYRTWGLSHGHDAHGERRSGDLLP